MNMPTTVFLTGATGVLGGRLLLELLMSTTAKIYCLSRDDKEEVATARIEKILQIYSLNKDIYARYKSRIVTVQGDLVKPYLGLKPDIYKALVQQVDLVIHSAANVKLFSSYKHLKPINIDGTDRIIRFCLSGDIPLIYISTFAVLGEAVYKEKFVFYESDLDIGQTFKNLDYARTKFEAEILVHNAGRTKLKWLIVRPGEIFGDSQTGGYPLGSTTVQGLFYEIFKSIIETGYSPFSEENFDISPVDYVAKATLHLAATPDAYGKTFHLVNPVHKYYYEIMNLLIEYGYKIRMLPLFELIKICKENKMLRGGKVYSSLFTNMMAFVPEPELYETARYDTSTAFRFLQRPGIVCPEVNIDLITVYLDYCVEAGYLPSPGHQVPLACILNRKHSELPA